VANKPDIVALKWVVGLMNKQAENAESALVDYSNNPSEKKPLLHCMWAVHQITSTLRALGMKKGEMLTLEMERSLNYIYKDKVSGERRKLTMGGLMQALKVLPAYLAHTQNSRQDTGQGLEQHVNDLRRWLGERPRPQAFFFNIDIPPTAGITEGAKPATDEEVKSRANVMLALYLEMAKMALRRRNVGESMKTVARVSRKMQVLFAGTEVERYWFTKIGLCEGIAGGLIVPDECIAQIFKTGAFLIKYARENGSAIDASVDYEDNIQHMLFYIASCKSKPVHIAQIRKAFGIDDSTLETASRGLVHIDAVMTALGGAMNQLDKVMEFINGHDLHEAGSTPDKEQDNTALDGIEAAECRLDAAGQVGHADSLRRVRTKLEELYRGLFRASQEQHEQAVNDVIRGIVDVKLDIEHKLEHGINSAFSNKEYELRESVVTATFTHMSLVENHLHQILRRKALASSLAKKPSESEGLMRLTMSLHRHLNKSDIGHEELRQALSDADGGNADIDLLCGLSKEFLDELEQVPDRKAIEASLRLLEEISGALCFAGMEREGQVIEHCHAWLAAASKAGSVREDDAFRCFADAFAQIELHLQRSLLDPLDDTSHMITYAEQRVAELDHWVEQISSGADAANPALAETDSVVHDSEISPEFRDVFIEEAEEIVAELTQLAGEWAQEPEVNQVLRDIRRHFHTFKGNGRAVGANILGELGWAAQDMLDRVLDGDLPAGRKVQNLVLEVIAALPSLVASYRNDSELEVMNIRQLTNRCFVMAKSGGRDPAPDMLSAGHNLRAAARQVSPMTATGTISQ
jgi:HPt (histidine-containing phosphotransfer) domain-containing protein/molecular chaperone GrpE (heat shock protein)